VTATQRREVRLKELMRPISHYTDAVLCGDFLYMSGAAAFDKDGNLVGAGDVVRQCEQTCENIDRMLSAVDMSPRDVVYFKVFMQEVYDGPKINPVRQAFHGASKPGSTRVGVGHFVHPGMLIEVECVAYKPFSGGPARREIRCENLFQPPSHYIDVVECGDFAFISGTGPIGPNGKSMHFGDVARQAHLTMENMQVMLDAVGMGFEDVAKVVCYLENIHDRPHINAARRRFFGKSRPASTLFGVRRLAIPGMNHEIEAIAYKPRDPGKPRRKEIKAEGIHAPISHYTDAVKCGDFLFVSGQAPFNKDLKLVGAGDIIKQAVRTHENLKRIMKAGGMGFGDIAKVTVYMENCEEHPAVNKVRRKYFGHSRPASTLFGANALALPGMKLEIDAICYKPVSTM